MNTQQVSQIPLFNPAPSSRKLSKSSISHFDQAIKHLRLILANGQTVQLYSNEFGKQFSISASTLTALTSLGALDRQKAGNGTFKYSAKALLNIIDPELVIKHIRQENERTADERRKKEQAAEVLNIGPNTITEGETGQIPPFVTGSVTLAPNPEDAEQYSAVYVVGSFDKITHNLTVDFKKTRFECSCDEVAIEALNERFVPVGGKLVLLKIIDVIEGVQVTKKSTL